MDLQKRGSITANGFIEEEQLKLLVWFRNNQTDILRCNVKEGMCDGGYETANMLQFKINPAELFSLNM